MSFIPTQKTLTIGGRTFTEAEITRFESETTGIVLTAHIVTSLRFSPFKTGAGAVFQVGGSNTLRMVAMKISSDGAATVGAQLVYSDDAAIFDDTTMTNIVYQLGQASSPSLSIPASGWNNGEAYFGSGFVVPSNKFPSFQASGAVVTVTVYCFID